jgi:putative CocE/NonD family hydrolase
MNDGATLRGDVYYPTNSDGDIQDGQYPVILTVSPYHDKTQDERDRGGAAFVDFDYIHAIFDVRGTGSSDGAFEFLGPREQEDYGELIHWAGDLPRSNGNVGMYGASYMGINQYLAARAAGPNSPLKALFPRITGVDTYRNVWFPGGLFNEVFNAFLFGSTTAGPLVDPIADADDMYNEDFIDMMEGRLAGGLQSGIPNLVGSQFGTGRAYREDYWRARAHEYALPAIVEYDIPVFHYTGWFDIFQPGSCQVYTQLQNLWAGRPQFAAMEPNQPVTGRYQSVVGPYFHATIPQPTVFELARLWFDRFLKRKQNGIDKTETPLHIFQVYGNRWVDAATWPLPDTTVETYYLGGGTTGTAEHSLNDGWLRTGKPATTHGSDTLPWRPTSNPCSRATNEKNAGLLASPGVLFGISEGAPPPCDNENRGFETTALAYTSEPFERGRDLAGPISATVFARATSDNTSWVLSLSQVAPDGSSRQLAYGALLGSFRELNEERSWYLPADESRPSDAPGKQSHASRGGRRDTPGPPESEDLLVRPLHDYTRRTETPIGPGEVERYDVLLTPILARIHPNHRLRLTIRTTAPWAEPFVKDVDDLVGGIYHIQRNRINASHLNIPFTDQRLTESSTNWGICRTGCGNSY